MSGRMGPKAVTTPLATTRLAIAVAILALVATGCRPSATPGPGNGVALQAAIQQVPCGSVKATACFRVRITNQGYNAGGGSCTLWGETHRTTYPGDTSRQGQRIDVPRLAPKASIVRRVAWTGRPRESYREICDPGLRS